MINSSKQAGADCAKLRLNWARILRLPHSTICIKQADNWLSSIGLWQSKLSWFPVLKSCLQNFAVFKSRGLTMFEVILVCFYDEQI